MVVTRIFSVCLAISSLVIFWLSLEKLKTKQFYSDTFWLVPLGIYIWGDALVLAPFWLGASFFFWFLPGIIMFRFWLLFLVVRAVYETVYWIVHQFSHKKYQAPLFRKVSYIGNEESAILYQLLNTVVIVGGLGLLSLSFWW